LSKERWPRVFENRVLRRIFGPKTDEVTGEWRKLHNEELSDMYSSTNVVRVVNKRRWAGHEARMKRGYIYIYIFIRFWWGNLRERDHLGDPGMDGSIISRWIFRMWHGWAWIGLIWLRIGTGGGHL